MNDNFKPTNLDEKFYDVSVLPSRYNITLDVLFEKVITFHKKIAAILGVDAEFIKNLILDKFQYDITLLVEFCTNDFQDALLVKEKGVYIAKWENGYEERRYFNVYVKQHTYLRNLGSQIARYVLAEKYPFIFNHPTFCYDVAPYEDECIFHIRRDTKLSDIGHILHVYGKKSYTCDYSVQDLIDVLTNNHRQSKTKNCFKIYYDDYADDVSIYLNLQTDVEYQSLTIPFNAIKKHDFNLIKKHIVQNIPLGNNKFYNGLQEEAPYFDNPRIKTLEKIFNENQF